MIHQLICEGQNEGQAVVVTTLRTVKYEDKTKLRGVEPVSQVTTAYYVVPAETARRLTKTNLFYTSDASNGEQISLVLGRVAPDIVRRRVQTGRMGFSPSPAELENDLHAVFGKHGGPMPVYRFTCDQAAGGVLSVGAAAGVKQVMLGAWSGKGLKPEPAPTARQAANCVPAGDAVGELDTAIPDGIPPDVCMVFEDDQNGEDAGTNAVRRDFETAFQARFPSYDMVASCYREDGRTVLAFDVDGEVSAADKKDMLQFAAEFGCSEPEEFDEPDPDYAHYRVYFYYGGEARPRPVNEGSAEPAVIRLVVPGERPKELWAGCALKMQDLSRLDGGEVTRVFATKRYSRAMGFGKARRRVAEGVQIVASGSTFDVRSVSASCGRLVVEARRVLGAGESAYNFPARLAERLEGPCGLPRVDELMFESWAVASGFKPGSASVLGGEYWCEDPAFGAPCECVKVLLKGKTV